jgi:hypothetical protein
MPLVLLHIVARLVLETPQASATEESQERAKPEASAGSSLRLSQLEPPRVPPPALLRMRGAPVRPLTLRETLEHVRFDRAGIEVAPKPTAVIWPSANPQAIPRVNTGLGVGHTVVLGAIEMYARGGATVGIDATPRSEDDDRHLVVAPLGRFGVGVRPTRSVHFGVDVARVGAPSFDPMGEEFRALASLRWRFSLVPRR